MVVNRLIHSDKKDDHIYISTYNKKVWSKIEKPNEVVIKETDIKINFTYPLSGHFLFYFHSDKGFTRRQVVEHIVDTYKQIYKEENETTAIPIQSLEERIACRNLINRNKTNGKYGIWGHDIGDLAIEKIKYNKSKKLVTISIGS